MCALVLLSSSNEHPSYTEKQKLIKKNRSRKDIQYVNSFSCEQNLITLKGLAELEAKFTSYLGCTNSWVGAIRTRQGRFGMRPLQSVIPTLCFAINPVCFHRYLSEVTGGHFRKHCLCNLPLSFNNTIIASAFSLLSRKATS